MNIVKRLFNKITQELMITPDSRMFNRGERPVVKSLEDATEQQIYYTKMILPLIKNNSDILDVGCGSGYQTFVFSFHTKGRVVGVDYSKTAIDFAKNYQNSNLTFVHLNALKIDLLEKFDLITCQDILEHLDKKDQPTFIRKAYNHLKPGGVLYILTTDKEAKDPLFHQYHKHEFTLSELKQFLKENIGRKIKIKHVIDPFNPLKKNFIVNIKKHK